MAFSCKSKDLSRTAIFCASICHNNYASTKRYLHRYEENWSVIVTAFTRHLSSIFRLVSVFLLLLGWPFACVCFVFIFFSTYTTISADETDRTHFVFTTNHSLLSSPRESHLSLTPGVWNRPCGWLLYLELLFSSRPQNSHPLRTLLPALRGHVEAGDHHQVGFAEVHPGLQFEGHRLQRLQVLQGVCLVGLLQLNWERWQDNKGSAMWGKLWQLWYNSYIYRILSSKVP